MRGRRPPSPSSRRTVDLSGADAKRDALHGDLAARVHLAQVAHEDRIVDAAARDLCLDALALRRHVDVLLEGLVDDARVARAPQSDARVREEDVDRDGDEEVADGLRAGRAGRGCVRACGVGRARRRHVWRGRTSEPM